jgi:uncharacterized protein (TIGR03083 family)
MSAEIRRYVHAVYGLDAVVQRIADDEWSKPSPCSEWVALDVVVHNGWALQMFTKMAHGAPAAVLPPADGSGVRAPGDDRYVFADYVVEGLVRLGGEYAADPLGYWNRDRDALVEALDEPGVGGLVTRTPWGEETDMDSWLGFALWDPLVHTWDLAEAVGQPTIVDLRLCELALRAARAHDAKYSLRRPGVAEPPIETSTSDPLDALLLFGGRNLDWRR